VAPAGHADAVELSDAPDLAPAGHDREDEKIMNERVGYHESSSSRPLRKLGFLTIGLFEEADPARGHESTLEIIELGERLGFDSAWVRHRHLQFGMSSPVAVLAAASQRTRRIHLGTAVIPLG
jgi:luciferase-like monooxygenase